MVKANTTCCQFSAFLQRLSACEKVLLASGGFAGLLYSLLDLPLRKPWSLYAERLSQGLALYIFALLLSLFVLRAGDIQNSLKSGAPRSWKETCTRWRNRYLSVPSLSSDIRLINVFALTFVIFIQLKHLIPYLRHVVYDDSFSRLERSLFSGNLFGELVQAFFTNAAAPFLSEAYMFFYPFMALTTMYVVLQRDEDFRQRFALSFALTWLLGILMIYAIPTWGPCFSMPESISLLPQTQVSKMQADLWMHREYLLKNPRSENAVFLISGFPSIHLAVPLLCAFLFFPAHRTFCALSVVTALVTFVSTLYFGWHFLLDDLGSFLLIGVALYCSRLVLAHKHRAKSTINSA